MKLQELYVKIAKKFIESYQKDKNIIGITLNGGVSRGMGDEFSEIDIHFYVKDKNKAKNFPPKIPGIGNDVSINGVWFDIHIYEIDKELKEKWNMDRRWDFAHSKILFQRSNVLTNLKKEKIKITKEEKEETEFLGYWSVLLSETFLQRNDIISAHLLLNEALNKFIDLYFLRSKEPIPYFKWRYYYFQKLKKPNNKIKNMILNIFKIKNYSREELKKRISLVRKVILRDLKIPNEMPFKQNKAAINNFIYSLQKGVKYSNPFK